jgi:hypothetical protein
MSGLLSCTIILDVQRPAEALSVLGRYQRHGLQPSLPALGSFIRYLSDIQEVQGLRKGEVMPLNKSRSCRALLMVLLS